jgi:ABC-type antimicrobial peptide transport system permease subunit
MLKSYFTTTIRNISRNLSHTVINIAGLVLGITGVITVYLITTYLMSFDKYHTNAENIYRVVTESRLSTGTEYSAGVPLPLPDAFKTDFPDVSKVAFVSYKRAGVITVNVGNETKTFDEGTGLVYLTSEFYQIFDRTFIAGDSENSLKNKNSVVLSARFAKKYFNSTNALGKTLRLDDQYDLTVTGVVEDFPSNSHFPFDVLISYETARKELEVYSHWANTSSDDQCYVLLSKNTSADAINKRLVAFSEKYNVIKATGRDRKYFLQPLRELQFDPRFGNYLYMTVGWNSILMMIAIGAFLLITAVVNFINLSTAASLARAKEVGIRKVIGGNRRQLIFQFLGETFVITLLALMISMCIVELIIIQFINPYLNVGLLSNFSSDLRLILFLSTLLISVTILAGFYPAFTLSGVKPVLAIKNKLHLGEGFSLRKALVVFQFVISQVFIIGTITMFTQMRYLKQFDMGFQREAIVIVPLPVVDLQKALALQHILQSHSGISSVSVSDTPPISGSVSVTGVYWPKDAQNYNFQVKSVDPQFLELYGIPLLTGKNIEAEDTFRHILVNEAMVEHLGFEKPEEIIGEDFKYEDRTIQVSGVVKNYNTVSLKTAIEPLFLAYRKELFRTMSIELKPGNWQAALKFIEQQWKLQYPDRTYDVAFLDEQIEGFYQGEERLSLLFSISCGVVIFIGVLGLYGLVLFMSKMKTKEIGIRKVHGASVTNIVKMFSWEFSKLVLVAFVLSAPMAWWLMSKFLQNYSYKTDLSWQIFLLGLSVTFIITFLTVGLKSLQDSKANPIDSLRTE